MASSALTYKNKVAIVTGGASGIGQGIVNSLANYGATVIIADMQENLAQSLVETLSHRGDNAKYMHLDVRDSESFKALVNATFEEFGRIDYLFNNAGICISGAVKDYSMDDWRNIIDINLMGVINGIQAVYPLMIKQGFGHIINTSSMSGLTPSPGLAGYSTTKHAVVGLSNALRVEAAFEGVKVSVMCPGTIRTPLLENGGEFGKQLSNTSKEQSLKDWEKLKPMDIHSFAEKALKAVAKNQAIIIYPSWYRIIWAIIRLSPLIIMKASAFQFKEQHIDRNTQ
jgi:NAD(P)-dependent dehydrogenase (short-subunit alcohol dehydrogenase family)